MAFEMLTFFFESEQCWVDVFESFSSGERGAQQPSGAHDAGVY